MKISLRKLEYAWHTFAFILLMGAFVPLWRQMTLGGVDPAEGDPVQRLFLGIAYLGVGLLIFHPRRALWTARRGWLVWALVGWALLSTLWSVAPDITLRRGLTAILGTLYGLLLAVRYRPEEVLRMVGTALIIVLVASLIAVAVMPAWAIMGPPHEGAWRGVMAHKNILGRIAALSVILFLLLRYYDGKSSSRYWTVWLILALILLIGSRSVSSLLALLFTTGAWIYLRTGFRLPKLLRPALFAGSIVVLVPIVYVIMEYFSDILGIFGKNITLTGRIPLWILLMPYAIARFWHGYGYGAFWASAQSPAVTVIQLLPWEPTHAHNGYLDVWLDIGVLGLIIFVFIILNLLKYAIKRASLYNSINGVIYSVSFLFVIFLIVVNMTYNLALESRLGTALYWILFVWLIMIKGYDRTASMIKHE